MSGKRSIALAAAVAAVAALACALAILVLLAPDAGASITGKPLPPAGSDWVIDNDTYVWDESIGISGNLIVAPGHTLEMVNSTLTITSTTAGQRGISVQANATSEGNLLVDRSTITSAQPDRGFTFTVLGNASLSMTKLLGVHNGLRLIGRTIGIRSCEVQATGTHGLYIDGSSPTVVDTSIRLSVVTTGTGIEVRGTTALPASPELSGISVRVGANATVTSATTTMTHTFSIVGFKSAGADLGTLADIDVALGEGLVATLSSNSNPKLTLTFGAVGIRLEGATTLDAFDNVTVRGDGLVASVTYTGTGSASVASTNSIVGLSNAIASTGSSPMVVSDVTVTDTMALVTTVGRFSASTLALTGIGIQWEPDVLACSGDALALRDCELSYLQADQAIKIPDRWNVTLDFLMVHACVLTTSVMSLPSWTHGLTAVTCVLSWNVVKDGAGDLLYTTRMSGPLLLDSCSVTSNYLARAFDVDAPLGEVGITNNVFDGNNHTQGLVTVSGAGVLGAGTLTIRGNSFTNNVCLVSTLAMVLVEHPKLNLTISENTFLNDSASGIVVMMPYTDATAFAHPYFTFTLEDNDLDTLSGYGMQFMNVDNSNIVVRGNTATACALGALVLDQASGSPKVTKPWATFTNYIQGPDSIIVEDNAFYGNARGGVYLRTTMFDAKYPTLTGNPYQSVTVRDNDLTLNGIDGWSLSIIGLYARPDVSGNDMDGSALGQYMEMTTDEDMFSPFMLTYEGLDFEGGDLGSTAFGFKGIGATFYNCSFKNYTVAVSVVGAEVNLLWCEVPVGSGAAVTGSVAAYNHLELSLTWVDAQGREVIRVPVACATVSLTASNGLAIRTLATDASGTTPVVVVKVWEVVDEYLLVNSPLKVAIVRSGESKEYWLDIHGERTGADLVRLTLNDRHVPFLTVSSPQAGSVVATSSVTLRGVLEDFGSGIAFFDARHDGMPSDQWEPVSSTTLWSHTFDDLTDGAHEFRVRTGDFAGNLNETVISITIDTEAPHLEALPHFLDETPVPFDAARQSYFTPQSPILIMGSFSDNVAPLDKVTIRLDGEVVTALGGQPGRITLRLDLHEGVNMLLLDATDPGGSRTSIALRVTLDRTPPVLYVYAPIDGAETRSVALAVAGLTEPAIALTFTVESVLGTNVYDHIDTPEGPRPILSDDDGTFSFEVELFEGTQVLLVSTHDTAGNSFEVELAVVLDTKTPGFEITSPTEQMTVTRAATWTVEGRMTQEVEAAVTVNGQLVDNIGTFSYRAVLQEGSNVIEVIATDRVGNSHTEVRTIIKDTVAPLLTMGSPAGDDVLTRDSTVTFSGSIKGASSTLGGASGVFLDIRGIDHATTLVAGTWDDGEWAYTLQLGTTDLDQTVTVKAVDEAGNVVERDVRIRYDVIPPVLHIESLAATTTSPMVYINGTTDETITSVLVGGMPFPVDDGTFSVPWFLAAGQNSIPVKVTDAAGNVNNDTVSTTLQWTEPGPEPVDGDEGDGKEGLSIAYPLALILAGITVLLVAVLLSPRRQRRDER